MTGAEGVTKYRLQHEASALPPNLRTERLSHWFRRCRERALIGRDPDRYDGYAYGNISQRHSPGFIISGTQTGGEPALRPELLAWVLDFDIDNNWLHACGPARPSSEAMTHGQVYRARPDVGGVIHVHSPLLWHAAASLGIATTPADVAYGTPDMARAVEKLLRTNAGGTAGLFCMGGHEDGLFAYGRDLDAAGDRLFSALDKATRTGIHD
ncbi:MAG: class II aldolase/adducin family protein [Gammaproteobacteria bacterium]|nr:class II aldolase/adducin family protein [Gammaproteobacteria bacterium]